MVVGRNGRFDVTVIILFFRMIFTLNKSEEPLEVQGHRLKRTTPRKLILPSRRKVPVEVKEKQKILEGTGNTFIKRKQWINIFFCSKDQGGCEPDDSRTYLIRDECKVRK